MREAPGIRAVGLGRRFGPVWAVRGLDFQLPAGRVTGVMGPNGAGKSTTLRLLVGLVRPTEGHVEIADRPLAGGPDRLGAPLRAIIDRPAFEPRFSGRENLGWLARLHPDSPDPAEVARALVRVGLDDHADRPVRTYSTGMLQRLAIAWCLTLRGGLIVLDEPLTGLDPQFRVEFRQILGELRSAGDCTLVLSSHILGDLEGLLDHLVLIHSGKVLRQGPVGELLSRPGRLRLRLRAEPREQALRVLDRMSGFERIDADPLHIRVDAPLGAAPALVEALVAARVRVHELIEENATLEEFYVSSVKSITPERAA